MHIIRSLDALSTLPRPLVTAIGVFDGVHLGHQQVISICRENARRENADAWVMTFDPHPLRVVMPDSAPPLLTTLPARLDILSGTGIHGCIIVPFTPAFAQLEPESFLEELVRRIPKLRGIVIGENWRFGRRARGNVELLRELSRSLDFHVNVASPVLRGGKTISSTRIREAVISGNLEDASAMLGRPHSVCGPVIHGMKRGRRLGFPTANIDVTGCALPPPGIYAAKVNMDGRIFKGALYLSAHPEPQHGAMEVHLLEYTGDLYGKTLTTSFIARIRDDDRRFDDERDLIRQIRDDVEHIREALK